MSNNQSKHSAENQTKSNQVLKPDSSEQEANKKMSNKTKQRSVQQKAESTQKTALKSSEEKEESTSKKSGKEQENKSNAVKKPSFMARFKGVIIWFIVFAAIAVAVVLTRQDLDWQVEHINDLQTKVSHLQQANKALEARLDSQMNEINTRFQEATKASEASSTASSDQQALITQADLDKIQQTSQEKLSQLQDNLKELSTQVNQQVQKMVSQASDVVSTTEQALKPSDQSLAALAQVEEKLQTQLLDVGQKLAELFDFKSAQQAQVETQSTQLSEISQRDLQQWVIEVNTQWVLRGNVAETQAQLNALQQVVAVSQLPKAAKLASLIGKDQAYLETYQTQRGTQPSLNTDALKQAIASLRSVQDETSSSQMPSEQGGGTFSQEGAASISQAESSFDFAMEKLKQTLSGMIRVKKRDEEHQITQVESLMLKDVLIQRALLLVDRIDWAIVSQSNDLLKQSVQDLQDYINQAFPKEATQFETLLNPFATKIFEPRKPLAIHQYLAEK